MKDLKENGVELYKDSICIVNSNKLINVYIIKIGHIEYILTYGEKLSKNFFINFYYLIIKGRYKEIKCKSKITWVFSEGGKKNPNCVKSERAATNYFFSFVENSIFKSPIRSSY